MTTVLPPAKATRSATTARRCGVASDLFKKLQPVCHGPTVIVFGSWHQAALGE
jgi:hypothetical protein